MEPNMVLVEIGDITINAGLSEAVILALIVLAARMMK
jgi:hypothetical protein